MIKRLIALVASLFIFGVIASSTAHASTLHRFVVLENNSPTVLSAAIAESLTRDPEGNAPISETSCTVHRACGTPAMLFELVKMSDKDAAVSSVADLPRFIATLVLAKAPEGSWWMACVIGEGARAVAKWDCLTRPFHKTTNETWFVNPLTGRGILARDCTNPVGKQDVPIRCVEKHVFLKEGDEFHSGWLGPDAFPKGDCIPAILKAGETEWGNMLLDECPRDVCDFSGPARDLGGLKVWDYPRISFVAEKAGEYVIRLPVEVTTVTSVFVDCVVRPDGRQTKGNVTGKNSYQSLGRAYLTYKDQEFSKPPANWHGLAHPWMFTDGKSD